MLQDNFNRTGPLNGSTPSTTAGSNWTAHAGFSTDGNKVSGSFGIFDFHGTAYVPLPVAITSGNVYTLSATMLRGLSTDDTALMAFGFFDAMPFWNGTAVMDEGHAIAIGPHNNRSAVANVLSGFVTGDLGVPNGTDGVTFGVRLYETASNTWAAVAVELAPLNLVLSNPQPISLANIQSIGMISGSLLPPYIDNFTLDVTSTTCSCPGDMNADGRKDGLDIQQFITCMISGGDCLCADMDGTPGLTPADITAFVSSLLAGATCS